MRVYRALRSYTRSSSIGFIGLGQIGRPMASALMSKSKDSRIILFDASARTTATVIEEQIQQGGFKQGQVVAASSPAEVAKLSRTVITMLPSTPHVREVYLAPETGLLAGLGELEKSDVAQSLFIDSTTLDQAAAVEVAEQMQGLGALMVDAPVSGGVSGAQAATLSFMVGATQEGFERAKPFLETMGKRIVHCGGNGLGLAAKISNNLLLAISMVGVSEAMLLGRKLGVDVKVLADIINSSTGSCWSSKVNNPCPGALGGPSSPPADRDYVGGFQTQLMKKDIKLAMNAASAEALDLPMGKEVDRIYSLLSDNADYATLDFSSVFKYLDPSKGEQQA